MFSILKRINGVLHYLIGGYRTLSNWPSYYLDLIRIMVGLRTKCKFYKLRDGTLIKILDKSIGLNYVFYSVFIKSEYDRLKEFKIKEDDIIIDIGAHMGFLTINAAKKAPRGKIYAFEPFSVHYDLLKTNIESNGISNVEIYKEAMSDITGELTFYYTTETALTDTSLYKINPAKKTFEEKVNSISLDDFFRNKVIDHCDLMKIDCEGAEYSILMHANKSSLEKIRKIAMEWHRFDSNHDPRQLAEYLKHNGFKLIEPSSYDKITGFLYAYR